MATPITRTVAARTGQIAFCLAGGAAAGASVGIYAIAHTHTARAEELVASKLHFFEGVGVEFDLFVRGVVGTSGSGGARGWHGTRETRLREAGVAHAGAHVRAPGRERVRVRDAARAGDVRQHLLVEADRAHLAPRRRVLEARQAHAVQRAARVEVRKRPRARRTRRAVQVRLREVLARRARHAAEGLEAVHPCLLRPRRRRQALQALQARARKHQAPHPVSACTVHTIVPAK